MAGPTPFVKRSLSPSCGRFPGATRTRSPRFDRTRLRFVLFEGWRLWNIGLPAFSRFVRLRPLESVTAATHRARNCEWAARKPASGVVVTAGRWCCVCRGRGERMA